MDEWGLRHQIYHVFAGTGAAPSFATIAGWVGSPEKAAIMLGRLHERHALVLDDGGEVQMALPFSAVETPHRVAAAGRSWWANCAWDALAIPLILGVDATIHAEWVDTGEPVELSVTGGELSTSDGFVHFTVPARHWWSDIVET